MKEMPDISYLRPVKASCFRTVYDKYEDRSGKLSVKTLEDVTVKAMGQLPGVTQNELRFIDDCDFYAECTTNDADAIHIKGSVLYGGYMRKSWGHFLMNSTARLWPLFKEVGTRFDKIVFFAEDKSVIELQGNFREFLSLLKILDKCVVLPEGTYRFDFLTVGEISLEMGRYYSAEFALPFESVRVTALASMNKDYTENRYNGIILVRSGWNSNDTIQINVRKIEQMFIASGYEPIHPESISLRDLIVRMHFADEVVSFSGSTAHNILFSPDTPLIIMERCALNNVYQTGIMKLTSGQTTPVDCFYQPLLTASTDNLTIYGHTDILKRFAEARRIDVPDFGISARSEFARYLKVYRRHYGYGAGVETWELNQSDAIFEAYFESRDRYKPYIDRRRPVLWSDYFCARVIFRFFKDILKNRFRH